MRSPFGTYSGGAYCINNGPNWKNCRFFGRQAQYDLSDHLDAG
jgi:hypothetical protein